MKMSLVYESKRTSYYWTLQWFCFSAMIKLFSQCCLNLINFNNKIFARGQKYAKIISNSEKFMGARMLLRSPLVKGPARGCGCIPAPASLCCCYVMLY